MVREHLTAFLFLARGIDLITMVQLITWKTGAIFRLRNIQLGYNFPQSMLSRVRIKNLRIYANVQNLKTFKHNLGYTTEYGGDATAFGYDNGGGAIPVISTFGLNVTF